MRKYLILALVALCAATLSAQTPDFDLGDPALEATLREMDGIPPEGLPGFFEALAKRFRFTREELERVAARNGLSPSDCYLAAYLARTRNMSLARVLERKRAGQAWGEVARQFGLGPGSAGLKALGEEASGDLLRIRERERLRLQTLAQTQTQTSDQTREAGSGGGTGEGPKK